MAMATLVAFAPFALLASWLDFKTRRIPNWLCLLCLVTGLGLGMAQYGPAILASRSLHVLVALLVGMILFRLHIIGGGDAKFYTAVAGWFPFAAGWGLLGLVSLAGLLLLTIWFVYRRIAGFRIVQRSAGEFDKFPYGVAIAAGGLLAGWTL